MPINVSRAKKLKQIICENGKNSERVSKLTKFK